MVPHVPYAQFCSASCMYTSLVPAAMSVWCVCVYVRERDIASAHTQPFSLAHTHAAVTHTHRSSESVARAALPEALARLLSRMMGGVCMCVWGSFPSSRG